MTMSTSATEPEPTPKSKSNLAGKLIGLVIFAAAVASVFLIDWKKEPGEEPTVVRPIKTMVIGETFASKGRTYPGKVSAGQQVNLAFEVSGNIVEQLIVRGDVVEEGELLMRLDDRDYQNQYNAAVTERDRTKAQLERMEKAAATGAVSKQEVDNARAALDQAAADVNIKEKALKDTELRAKYAGMIGDIFVKQFQTVQAKQKILSLIDLASIEIDVSVPESVAAMSEPEIREKLRLVATFDFYPGEEFEVEIKEFATQADPATQTYTVTVTMPRPEGRNLLPGMTATLRTFLPPDLQGADSDGFAVPLDAVPVDGQGDYFVWKLKPTGSGTFIVHRVNVEVGELAGSVVAVRGKNGEDLARGDLIALAGVNVLTEGREVRRLTPEQEAKMLGGDATPPDAATGEQSGR